MTKNNYELTKIFAEIEKEYLDTSINDMEGVLQVFDSAPVFDSDFNININGYIAYVKLRNILRGLVIIGVITDSDYEKIIEEIDSIIFNDSVY